ncbi:4Fe-4S binding protein [Desnuesiella massiliensis]|uniref:4Fe-4S binding protein n=1 Tax=Desnuesiella massiliensis TaxID=1650662 RepID=UPI0006E28817|nr:4Fe-4S binding protein [Desnuesiella massiliensis]
MGINISQEEKTLLKGQGFLLQRDGEHFACRIITVNGTLNAERGIRVSEIAEKYGRGYMSFTSRLAVEIPWIKYEDIPKVKEELHQVGLYSGGTGTKVRPVVACKGTVCVFGLYDTQELAKKVHERFYIGYNSVKLPHKFKIGIGGCPNNCIKPDLNDFGIMGQRKPLVDKEICRGCKKCAMENACKMKAAKVIDGKLHIDRDKCINCGVCINKCYFKSASAEVEGLKVLLGGKWGRTGKAGYAVEGIYSEEEVMNMIERTLLFYKENGMTKERFGDMIERIGIDKVKEAILTDEIMKRKEQILKSN